MSETLEKFSAALASQAKSPPKINGVPDMSIALFSRAFSDHIAESPETAKMMERTLDEKVRHAPVPSSYSVNMVMRLCQMEWMDNEAYPFGSYEEYREHIDGYMQDPAKRDYFSDSMIIWNVGSDVETRIAGPKLVAQTMMPDKVNNPNDPLKVLCIGSARNHGLAMWDSSLPLPYIEATVDPKPDAGNLSSADIRLTKKINKLVNAESQLGDCMSVDMWSLRDREWSRFLRACRYYPMELLDPQKREMYDTLEELRDAAPNLVQIDTDFSDAALSFEDPSPKPKGLEEGDQYDMAIYSVCLYQNYPDRQRRMLENGIQRLKKGGKVVVQDFVPILPISESHPTIDTQLKFPDDWFDDGFPFTTAVYDSDRPNDGLRTFARWTDGRLGKMAMGEVLKEVLTERTRPKQQTLARNRPSR